MKDKDVPQDPSILEGHQRACYAVNDLGRYVVVPSSGWSVEKVVNAQAVDEIRAQVEAARQRVQQGLSSPLEYHMARRQMTPGMLAAETGLWRLRVRRHLKPESFAKLSPDLRLRYATALGMSTDELQCVPDTANTHD
jgi:hypothetical protein